MKLPISNKIQVYGITLAIAGTCSATQVQAQPTTLDINTSSNQERFAQSKPNKTPPRRHTRAGLQFVLPKLPDKGAPTGRRKGAAGRGNCPAVDPPLTALVPERTMGSVRGQALAATYVWGLTVADYPTFWFYIPDLPPSTSSGEFVLQDEMGSDIYRTPITLPGKSGIVSVRLPSTTAPLETSKMYHWYFKVDCNQQGASGPVFVEGWVQRVTPNPTLESQLAAATPQQQVALYAANGIWHEALTSLAKLRQVNPEDTALTTDWAELLQSAGLGEVVSAPIVQCCTPKNLEAAGASQVQKDF